MNSQALTIILKVWDHSCRLSTRSKGARNQEVHNIYVSQSVSGNGSGIIQGTLILYRLLIVSNNTLVCLKLSNICLYFSVYYAQTPDRLAVGRNPSGCLCHTRIFCRIHHAAFHILGMNWTALFDQPCNLFQIAVFFYL